MTQIDTHLDAAKASRPGTNPSDLNHVPNHQPPSQRSAARPNESRHNPTKPKPDKARRSTAKSDPLRRSTAKPDPSRRSNAKPDPSRRSNAKPDPSRRSTARPDLSRRSAAKTDSNDRTAPVLSPIQLKVLEKLLLGTTITKAAAAVGVDRSTIHRWLNEDFEFQAEFNRRHNNLTNSFDDGLLNIAARALPHLDRTLRQNPWAIIALLKGIGVLSGGSPSYREEDPRRIEEKYIRRRNDFLL